MKDFSHFSKRIILSLIRKVFYELPAMVLILDTRLLLKHDLKPPWERLYANSKGYIETVLFSSKKATQQDRRMNSRMWKVPCPIKKWISLFIVICFIIPLVFLIMQHQSFSLTRLWDSKESSEINHDNIANTIIEDDHLRTRIRQRIHYYNIVSLLHQMHSANTNLLEEVEHLYRDEVYDKFTSYTKFLQGESFDHHQLDTNFIHEALKKVRDNLVSSKRQKNISTSALTSIENIESRFSIIYKKLQSCLNHTESKMDQLQLYLNFFQNEEIYLLAQSHFVYKEEYSSHIDEVHDHILNKISAVNSTHVTIEEVQKITNELVYIYDLDKTGKFDFALESAGGSILTTRCTESLINYKALYTIFGFNVWYPSHNPRLAIQHGALPGECWSFKGSTGSLVIKLSNLIFPKEISIEHIPKFLTPGKVIDSAPKNFKVLGLASENDENPMLLGNFSYLDNGLSLQSFQVQFPPIQPFSILEVIIHSNHGHPNYTCLYRVRAHGTLFL